MRPIDADALMEYCNNMKDKTIDANDIARFPTAGGWISVDDRMPEYGEPVLFTGKSSYGARFITQRGWWDGTIWRRDAGEPVYSSTPVTHWMPLPKPPEEVSTNAR